MRKKIRGDSGWTKYNNIKTVIDGFTFDSKKESDEYINLKIRLRNGDIKNLELQPKFPITINGVKICTYKADFAYEVKGKRIVVDVKSKFTAKLPVYRLKNKLLKAVYGIEVLEA